jgi:hypothetical protein
VALFFDPTCLDPCSSSKSVTTDCAIWSTGDGVEVDVVVAVEAELCRPAGEGEEVADDIESVVRRRAGV